SPAEPIMLVISIPRVPVLPVFSISGEMDHCVRPPSFLCPVMNEAEIRRVDIGAIAGPQSLVGRRRLPSREYGSGNGASGSRERQERGRVVEPMLSLPARGFVPGAGRFCPTSAGRARCLIDDGPILSGSVGTVVSGL